MRCKQNLWQNYGEEVKIMNNLYLVITPTISLVGGAQIYSLNKLHYYQRKGWNTLLIHANIGVLLVIEEMKKYEDSFVDEFKFFPFYYPKKKVKSIIDNIVNRYQLNSYSSVIIETHNAETALWGELLANQIQAKNFVYILSEYPVIKPNSLFEFYSMKECRGELAGITNSSIPTLFRGYKQLYEGSKYHLEAICSNSLGYADEKRNPTFDNYDYMLGTVGRMEKPFLVDAIDEIILFANKHKSKKIAILFIGDGNDEAKNNIISKIKSVNNIQYEITGPIFPIPVNLIQKPNLFFGVAGSCTVPRRLGKLTVSFDVNDHCAIGLLGITTNNSIYRGRDESPLRFSEILEKVLIEKKYMEKSIDVDIEEQNKIDFSNHDSFIIKSSQIKQYYNVLNINNDLKGKVIKCMIALLGTNKTFQIKTKF